MSRDAGTIAADPPLVEVRELLRACALPVDDLDGSHPVRFLGWRRNRRLAGVVGLELFGEVALLRSLAVEETARGEGLGAEMLACAERTAAAQGVCELFLLTTTAAEFFRARGYRDADRDGAPAAIRATAEFADLCPADSACLSKRLAPPAQRT